MPRSAVPRFLLINLIRPFRNLKEKLEMTVTHDGATRTNNQKLLAWVDEMADLCEASL